MPWVEDIADMFVRIDWVEGATKTKFPATEAGYIVHASPVGPICEPVKMYGFTDVGLIPWSGLSLSVSQELSLGTRLEPRKKVHQREAFLEIDYEYRRSDQSFAALLGPRYLLERMPLPGVGLVPTDFKYANDVIAIAEGVGYVYANTYGRFYFLRQTHLRFYSLDRALRDHRTPPIHGKAPTVWEHLNDDALDQ